jgi:hypothetical protein
MCQLADFSFEKIESFTCLTIYSFKTSISDGQRVTNTHPVQGNMLKKTLKWLFSLDCLSYKCASTTI